MPLSQVEELGGQDGRRDEAQAQEAGDGDEGHVLEGRERVGGWTLRGLGSFDSSLWDSLPRSRDLPDPGPSLGF